MYSATHPLMVQHLKSGNKGEVWWEQRKTCTAGLIAEHMYATAEGQVNLQSTDISIRLKDTSPPDNTWAGAAGGGGGGGYSSYKNTYLRQSTLHQRVHVSSNYLTTGVRIITKHLY